MNRDRTSPEGRDPTKELVGKPMPKEVYERYKRMNGLLREISRLQQFANAEQKRFFYEACKHFGIEP